VIVRSLAVALLMLWSGIAVAGKEVPFLSGRVNDEAGMLSSGMAAELEAALRSFEDSTSNQVVILTVPSLEGEVLEEYSYTVASTWKLGTAKNDNGILLLIVRDDRKVRIEVGSGLEGDLTDLISGLIIRREIVPRFKSGDYDGGIKAGVIAIMEAIKGTYSAGEEEENSEERLAMLLGFGIFLFVVGIFTLVALFTTGGPSWFLFVFLIPFWFAFPTAFLGFGPGISLLAAYLIGFPIAKYLLSKSPKGRAMMKKWVAAGGGRGWSSGSRGSSGGSSFSGGGGSFSGGGASGSW